MSQGDRIVYARAFGEATLGTNFHMASLAKPFTATAIVRLAQEGKLSLDDPIVRHLPTFALAGEGFEQITIEQVLTHTSGIPRNIPPHALGEAREDDAALAEFVRSLRDYPLEFEPGSRYAYSNVAYSVLGQIVAELSGESFESFMQREILDAAGMGDSTFHKPDPIPPHWAWPHERALLTERLPDYPYDRRFAPAAALHANVLDMCRWGMLNLNRGEHDGRRILEPAYHDRLLDAHFETPWGEQIGLSWFLQHYEGRRTILHTGQDPGFETQIVLYPDDDVAIVVLANYTESRTARIANAAAEVLFDMEIKPYTISARIPFGRAVHEQGLAAAKPLWQTLGEDERYFTNEWEMNVLGHSLIRAELHELARQIFAFNIELHPDSANTYDSYGDALLADGRPEEALVYFRKALEVDPEFAEPVPKIARIEAERS